MNTNNKKILLFGLVIFYLITFFSPNKIISFAAFFISTFFFYLGTKNIQKSLVHSLILSLFSVISIASSLFLLEPSDLNLSSGYRISPTTIIILFLLPFIINYGKKNIKINDFTILLLFIWAIVILIVFPNTNVLFGFLLLSEACVVYLLLRLFLQKEDLPFISYLIISMLLFQSVIGSIQFLFQRPLGLSAEVISVSRPYGVTAAENENIFRLTGTFGHPNFFASFLLVSIPFVLFINTKNIFIKIAKIVPIFILVFTYSRAAWFIFALLYVLFFIKKESVIKFFEKTKRPYFIILGVILMIFLITPYLYTRLDTINRVFERGGSWDVRVKLINEGLNILSQYPLTGVGFNRSVQTYFENPITEIDQMVRPSSFYKIHNTFVEIAAESGLPGLILFSGFLLLAIKKSLTTKLEYPQNAAFMGLLGLIGISLFNPFLHTTHFRFFFLLSAIILV